jgi:hypothetical protein
MNYIPCLLKPTGIYVEELLVPIDPKTYALPSDNPWLSK